MSVRRLGALLVFLQLLAVAFAWSARSQQTVVPAPAVTLDLPPVVEVGRTGVPATLRIDAGTLGLSVVTDLTLDLASGGSLAVAPTAQGTGLFCQGFVFAVSGPDAAGRYHFTSGLPILLLPIVSETCTIGFTFDARRGVPGGQVTAVATLTGLPLAPLLAGTATGRSVMAVTPVVPTVRTTAGSPSAAPGSPIGSGVAVDGGAVGPGTPTPTGSVTFRLFGPDDATCAGPPTFTSDPVQLAGGAASSPPFVPASPGTYRWSATYEGDVNYATESSNCGDPAAATAVASPAVTSAPATSAPATSAPATTVSPPPTGADASSTPPPSANPPGGDAESDAPPEATPEPGDQPPAPYDPAAHASDVVDHEVGAFVLISIALGVAGGRAASRAGSSSDKGDPISAQVGVSEGGVLAVAAHRLARGDRSRTWRWPGTKATDKLSLTLPLRVAAVSPLGARITDDAAYLRAILGSASVILPLAALVLGVLAVRDVHGEALPPTFALLMAIAVLGVLDATAGVIAVAVFAAGVVLLGGLTSADAVRTLLAVGVLWFAAPIIAGAARPLLRNPTTTMAEHWDRLADIVIASLIGAWAVQQFLQALPILSGLDLPVAKRADAAALIVLAALALRMIIETVAAHWYPHRLMCVQPHERPGSWRGQRITAKVITLGLFLFVAASYVGVCWQLYAGAVLFIIPQLLEFFEHRLPNSPRLYSVLPHGIVQIVLLLFVAGYVGVMAGHFFPDGLELVRWSFFMLSLPGFAFAMLDRFGREGPARKLGWRHQVLGTLILVLGVLGVLGVVGF